MEVTIIKFKTSEQFEASELRYNNEINVLCTLFARKNIEKADNIFLSLDDLYYAFRCWIKEKDFGTRMPSKPEIRLVFNKILGNIMVINDVKGYKDYKLNQINVTYSPFHFAAGGGTPYFQTSTS